MCKNKAVIIAGGLGTRLMPVTSKIPKALLEINGKPIINQIILGLKYHGFNEIILCLNYKSSQIISYINNNAEFNGINISWVIEDEPLGSIGPLHIIKNKLDKPFLVMFCDTLTDLNYSEFLKFHISSNTKISIALHKEKINIDYGVVELNNSNMVSNFQEKPEIDYMANMGLYAFHPDILKYINGSKMEDNELINMIISNNEKISGYVFSGLWEDIKNEKSSNNTTEK